VPARAVLDADLVIERLVQAVGIGVRHGVAQPDAEGVALHSPWPEYF
jgi:hypothetical protein